MIQKGINVLIPFLFANFETFLADSIPNIF